MQIGNYLCTIPCEYQDFEYEYIDYTQARLHAALNAGYVRDMKTGCIMCDYRDEEDE